MEREVKLSLLAADMIAYLGNLRESMIKLRIKLFSKVG